MKSLIVGDFFKDTQISKLNRELFYLSLNNNDEVSVLPTDMYDKQLDDKNIDKYIGIKQNNFDFCVQNVNHNNLVYEKRCGQHITILLKEEMPGPKNKYFNYINLNAADYATIKSKNKTIKRNDNMTPELSALKNKYKYILYTIISKENAETFDSLFISYHKAFDPYDNVALVIYTDLDIKVLNEKMNQISSLLNKNKYNHTLLMNKKIDVDLINMLHTHCHCFFGYSSDGSLCLNAFDAYLYGNKFIFGATKLENEALEKNCFILKEDFSFNGCNNNRMTCVIKEISDRLKFAYTSNNHVKQFHKTAYTDFFLRGFFRV